MIRPIPPGTRDVLPDEMRELRAIQSALLGTFEAAGFRVRAAQDLVPDLLPPPGLLSAAAPTRQHEADARRAEEVHRILAPADIGQGLIVRQFQVGYALGEMVIRPVKVAIAQKPD